MKPDTHRGKIHVFQRNLQQYQSRKHQRSEFTHLRCSLGNLIANIQQSKKRKINIWKKKKKVRQVAQGTLDAKKGSRTIRNKI
jgi:hypothetical protein